MENRKQIYGTLEDGTKVVYDVILTFHNDNNDKDYIVYTDNKYDSENKLKIYASIYNSVDNTFIGHPTTAEEWYEINKVIDKVLLDV
jgi:uncharacterized protein YrzB (UPF0473 family)